MIFCETFADTNSKFQHSSDFMVCTGSVVSRGQERKGSFWTFKGFHLKNNFLNLDESTCMLLLTPLVEATSVHTVICWPLFLLLMDFQSVPRTPKGPMVTLLPGYHPSKHLISCIYTIFKHMWIFSHDEMINFKEHSY